MTTQKTFFHLIGELFISEGSEVITEELFIIHIMDEDNMQVCTLQDISKSRPELENYIVSRTGNMQGKGSIWLEKAGAGK